jgi:hypothetical protein
VERVFDALDTGGKLGEVPGVTSHVVVECLLLFLYNLAEPVRSRRQLL